MRHGVTRKRSTKTLKDIGNLFRKNIQLKPLKATKIIGQWKGFYSQRIPESLAVQGKKLLTDILETSRNDKKNHAIYHNNEQTSLENKALEPVEPVLNIYQSNTYRKGLSCLYFDNVPNVLERRQVKDQQSCISVFVVYQEISSTNQEHQPRHDNSISCMAVWYTNRNTKQPLGE